MIMNRLVGPLVIGDDPESRSGLINGLVGDGLGSTRICGRVLFLTQNRPTRWVC